MVQQGSYCTLVNQLSNASIPNFGMSNIPYSYIQHKNSNLSANNFVSTYYKADTSDATITVYQNPGVGTLENKGRMRLDASSFEPSCNIIQTGPLCKTVSNASGSILINHFNNNDPTVYNTVGTQHKADPTKSTTVSDASIVVTPHPISSMFTTPATDYGTLSVNSQNIVLGNKTSTISIPGTLMITYVDSTSVSHQVSLGQFLSQTSRTRYK